MSDARTIKDYDTFCKLWLHENLRVFKDRMKNEEDILYYTNTIIGLGKTKLGMKNWANDMFVKSGPLYFGEIYKEIDSDEDRTYDYINETRLKNLKSQLNIYQNQYNSEKDNASRKTALNFFEYAISHILRITRVFRLERGNMLLIGHGGTGKQSLTRFAAYCMNKMSVFTMATTKDMKLSKFRKEIKDSIKKCGMLCKNTVFLLTDNNIVGSFVLEDVNNLLNNGEIPGLFDGGEQSEILQNLPPETTFIENIRKHLHIVFATSPVGEDLKIRIRKYPSLINCCTLDWFDNWPADALTNCSEVIFKDLTLIADSQKESLVKICSLAHKNIEDLALRCANELNRIIYITPKSFLDMNSILTGLLIEKRKNLETIIRKLSDGLKKLGNTRENIKVVEKHLEILGPQLIENEKEANEAVDKVNKNQIEIEEKSKYIREKQEETNKLVSEITSKTKEIESKQYEVAKSLSEKWEVVEKNLNPGSILEVTKQKFNNNPKPLVVIEGVVYAFVGSKIKTTEFNTVLYQNRARFLNFKDEIVNGNISDNTMKEVKNYVSNLIPAVYFADDDKVNDMDDDRKQKYLEEKLQSVGLTIKAMYYWARAIVLYWELDKEIKPINERIAKFKALKDEKEKELNQLTTELQGFNENLKKLEEESNELVTRIKNLKDDSELNTRRKRNATQLISLLGNEGERWEEQLKKFAADNVNFVGNMFLSAVFLSYLAPFPGSFRKKQLAEWKVLCESNNLPIANNFNLEDILSDPVQIREWQMSGLPSDNVSIENTIMIFNNSKNALLIDPQMQANTWLKKHFKKANTGIKVFKADVKEEGKEKFKSAFRDLVTQDSVVLLENLGESIDSLFENVMSKNFYGDLNNLKIDFDGYPLDYNENFKLFFTTKLACPHYPPEYYLKLNIINFTVTTEGLTEQLLGDVFKKEKREKYEIRDGIIEEMGRFKIKLKEAENFILDKLYNTNEKTILDDEGLIEALKENKAISIEVAEKFEKNKEIEYDINMVREIYNPVAIRGSLLYFTIVDLSTIDPMYQFSLEYFKEIFIQSIERAPKFEDDLERVSCLITEITKDIFSNIKRSIFERHKSLFSFLIITNILKNEHSIRSDEWNLFLKGPDVIINTEANPNPDPILFNEIAWQSLMVVESLYSLQGFCNYISNNLKSFKQFFEVCDSFDSFKNFPFKISKNNFLKLLLIKCFKPYLLPQFIIEYVKIELDEYFIMNTPPKINEVYIESNCKMPIIFILSKGADPTNEFLKFRDECNIINSETGLSERPEVKMLSLGQGMEQEAKDSILNGMRNGTWVVLNNCHLFDSWMGELASIIQNIKEDELPPYMDKINDNFRLWLTSQPNKNFPVSILQSSIKMTIESPIGIRNNMIKFMSDIDVNQFKASNNEKEISKIIYTLALFHSVIQDRKKYGEIGFNKVYDFNITDFNAGIELLKNYMKNIEDDYIPWDDIRYLLGDVNYGGRITDDFDKITMKATLEYFLNDGIVENDLIFFSKSGTYKTIYKINPLDYLEVANELPLIDDPEIFGMHKNAEIIFQLQECNFIIDNLINIMPKSSGSKGSMNDVVMEKLTGLIYETPNKIDKRDNRHKSHEKTYDNGLFHSLTIVMDHEIDKYNKLLVNIKSSLENLKLGIQGTISMSALSDELLVALFLNKVPRQWELIGYSSTKPLSTWYNDLKARVEYISNWVVNGHPYVHWISGLFYPKGFITGVLQNHARETKIPVSDIIFDFQVLPSWNQNITKNPTVSLYLF